MFRPPDPSHKKQRLKWKPVLQKCGNTGEVGAMNKLSDKKRILYVDGYEDNRLLMLYMLDNLGYDCLAVSTMSEGQALARSGLFDLYILDTWYKDGTGLELCARIRSFDETAPILFFSAWTLDSARQEALRAGATAYLHKPALDTVLMEIGRLLKDSKPRYGVRGSSRSPLGPRAAPGRNPIGWMR
jgi:DNA-binding response OmpR family regulator